MDVLIRFCKNVKVHSRQLNQLLCRCQSSRVDDCVKDSVIKRYTPEMHTLRVNDQHTFSPLKLRECHLHWSAIPLVNILMFSCDQKNSQMKGLHTQTHLKQLFLIEKRKLFPESYANVISPVKHIYKQEIQVKNFKNRVKLFITWLWFLPPWHFDSQSLRLPNAENLSDAVKSSITNLENRKMSHLSMDSPNTKWAVLESILILRG